MTKKGFALIEIMVATSIILVALVALLSAVERSSELARQSLERDQAAFLLEEGAESVKLIRDNNWTNISGLVLDTPYYLSFSGTSWSLETTPNKVDIFTRTVTVSAVSRDGSDDIASSGIVDTGTKKITVSVSWPSERGTLTESLSFYIANIFS